MGYIVSSVFYMYDTLVPRDDEYAELSDLHYVLNKAFAVLTLILWGYNLRLEMY